MHGFTLRRHFERFSVSAVCAALCSTAPLQVTHAQAPPPGGGMPITAITGGPVSAPSTDSHNFEGIWAPTSGMLGSGGIPKETRPGESPSTVAFALTLHPQAQATAERLRLLSANSTPVATPHSTCRPTGIAGMALKFPVVIVQTPEKLVFLMEEDRDVYQIFLNRDHPAQVQPSYNGDSVARWDGNTLVVDTVGYNGWGYIDESWHPNSAQTHLVQRFTKSADGRTLDIETILDDPKNYTAPSHVHQQWTWDSGARQAENDCSEEPIDPSVHFVYENERFRPVCSVVATGEDSKVVCERPKRDAKQQPQK